jgi:hypothetical protein
VPKSEKTYEEGNKVAPIYHGTVATATVMYRIWKNSLFAAKSIVCKVFEGDKFRLKIYGDSEVLLNEVSLDELKTTIYGESNLVIKAGTIKEQKYTAYGESKINSLGINSNTTKITAYGEADFQLNVSDEIRLTAYGEAVVNYKGNPVISKGINIGEVKINRID